MNGPLIPVRRVAGALTNLIVGLPANTATEIQVPVGGNDFEIESFVAKGSSGAFSINFVPSDSDMAFATMKTDAILLFGSYTVPTPYRLDAGAGSKFERPLRVTKASTITVQVQETSGAVQTIWVVFLGKKIFGA